MYQLSLLLFPLVFISLETSRALLCDRCQSKRGLPPLGSRCSQEDAPHIADELRFAFDTVLTCRNAPHACEASCLLSERQQQPGVLVSPPHRVRSLSKRLSAVIYRFPLKPSRKRNVVIYILTCVTSKLFSTTHLVPYKSYCI